MSSHRVKDDLSRYSFQDGMRSLKSLISRHPAVGVVTLVAFVAALLARASARPRPTPVLGLRSAQAISTQQAFFPYWSMDNGFASTVVFTNATMAPITAEPTLYNIVGDPLPVTPFVVPPRSRLAAPIAGWIAETGQTAAFTEGSLNVTYQASDSRSLGSQLVITDPLRSLSFDVRHEAPINVTPTVSFLVNGASQVESLPILRLLPGDTRAARCRRGIDPGGYTRPDQSGGTHSQIHWKPRRFGGSSNQL
jgi:hypothetical protein